VTGLWFQPLVRRHQNNDEGDSRQYRGCNRADRGTSGLKDPANPSATRDAFIVAQGMLTPEVLARIGKEMAAAPAKAEREEEWTIQ
jgi:hypothetical protein